jgi:beta-ketoacyl-acyl-carrier-protein synthase II
MEFTQNGHPRVVITGLGAVSPLGPIRAFWESLKAGISGIRRLQTIETEHLPIKYGGEVREFDPSRYIEHKEARRMGRCSQFAVIAAKEALEDAGFTAEQIAEQGERVGVVIGTTMGPHEVGTNETLRYRTTGRKPNPLGFVNCLPNMPSHYVSRFTHALGPLHTPSSACASGTQGVADGCELIRTGRCDIVISGGVEALMLDYVIAGFEAMQALASEEYNEKPEAASRPFDAQRSGFVMSEGCGVLILESLEHAYQRGARIYGEVLGHAASSDAFHVAALDPHGAGAIRCMRWALQDAQIDPAEIQYINAHGTSTPANDAMETNAIKTLFGEHAYKIPISSTKSMIGHALGGAGALEAIATVLTLCEGIIHPTINYEHPDPECDLDYVPNTARDAHVKIALSNSFGLGGQNASLVLGTI